MLKRVSRRKLIDASEIVFVEQCTENGSGQKYFMIWLRGISKGFKLDEAEFKLTLYCQQ